MPDHRRDLIDAIRRLADDLERILAGNGPTAADLEGAPLLHPWMQTVIEEPALMGTVSGHPLIGDKPLMVTSGLFAIDPDHCWARTLSRYYRLGISATQRAEGCDA